MSDNKNPETDEERLLNELFQFFGGTDPISFTDAEIEQHRREDLKTALDDRDTTLDELVKRFVNEVGIHEALHSGWMFTEMVSSYLIQHPAVLLDPIAYRHAFNAHTALFNMYQRLGQIQHKVVTKEEQAKE